MHALIAEPSHSVSLVLSMLFQNHGIASSVARTGEEALAALGKHRHTDLLCLAYELGDMTGIDCVLAARKNGLLRNQPVVLFASTHDEAVIDLARLAGIAECFSKNQKSELEKFIANFVAHKMQAATRQVLVVDDSVTNRKIIEALLKKQGLDVHTVENGQEALDHITKGNLPDLILMDCQMPLMDGYEATRHIRQWEREGNKPHMPIIALTGGSSLSDRDHCIVSGMNDYLSKPVSLKSLVTTLERWLPR